MDNPIFIGKVLHDFDHLPSTNQYAIDLVSKSNPSEGTVISTYNQYEGRGQIGSGWESAPNRNISLSVILYPNFLKPTQQFELNKAISLGVRSFLSSQLQADVFIKWPNDLFVNDKKIGGILIQNNISSSQIKSSIIGIGINVNQKIFETAPNATSLSIITDSFFELNQLRIKLFAALEYYYLKLKSGSLPSLKLDYLDHLLNYNKPALYQDVHGERFLGTIVGVDDLGKILLVINGKEEAFNIKEIQLVN